MLREVGFEVVDGPAGLAGVAWAAESPPGADPVLGAGADPASDPEIGADVGPVAEAGFDPVTGAGFDPVTEGAGGDGAGGVAGREGAVEDARGDRPPDGVVPGAA
ncbi:MAG: hypothetical protein ABI083_14600 [Lapillicoccus sp.]